MNKKSEHEIFLDIDNQYYSQCIISGLLLLNIDMEYPIDNKKIHSLYIEELNTNYNINDYTSDGLMIFIHKLRDFLYPPYKYSDELKISFSELLLILCGIENLLYKIKICSVLNMHDIKTRNKLTEIKKFRKMIVFTINIFTTEANRFDPQIILSIPKSKL